MERLVRISLWVTAPFNLLAGYLFAFPSSALAGLLMMPASPTNFYTLFAGAMVALFGFMYIWIAQQGVIVRPLLAVGAIGKTIAVMISVSLFVTGNLAWLPTLLISGDLLFASLWGYYLIASRSNVLD